MFFLTCLYCCLIFGCFVKKGGLILISCDFSITMDTLHNLQVWVQVHFNGHSKHFCLFFFPSNVCRRFSVKGSLTLKNCVCLHVRNEEKEEGGGGFFHDHRILDMTQEGGIHHKKRIFSHFRNFVNFYWVIGKIKEIFLLCDTISVKKSLIKMIVGEF